jgi:hypothetical protein
MKEAKGKTQARAEAEQAAPPAPDPAGHVPPEGPTSEQTAQSDAQFRRDLRTMEKDNEKFFGEKKTRHGGKA